MFSIFNVSFVACSQGGGVQPILKINVSAINAPMNVYFDGCSPREASLVSLSCPSPVIFERCTFQSMNLALAVVEFESSTEIMFEDVQFISVKMTTSGTNLLDMSQLLTKLEFDNVTVDGCKFSTLGDMKSASIVLQDSDFRQIDVDNNLLASQGGTSVQLLDCIFNACISKGNSVIALSGSSRVNLSAIAFKDCSCESGALVTITEAESVFIGGSCFQGLKEGLRADGYISCTCKDATFELPMCFSLSQEDSISFGDVDPLQNIDDPSAIFNCRNCSFIPGYDSEPDISDSPPPEQNENPLSPGAIAGIVIGVLVFIAALVLIIVFLVLRRKHSEEKTLEDEPGEMNEETVDATITSVMTDEWNGKVTEDVTGFTNTSSLNEPEPFSVNEFEEAFY